jgi:hypothetical protein
VAHGRQPRGFFHDDHVFIGEMNHNPGGLPGGSRRFLLCTLAAHLDMLSGFQAPAGLAAGYTAEPNTSFAEQDLHRLIR